MYAECNLSSRDIILDNGIVRIYLALADLLRRKGFSLISPVLRVLDLQVFLCLCASGNLRQGNNEKVFTKHKIKANISVGC